MEGEVPFLFDDEGEPIHGCWNRESAQSVGVRFEFTGEVLRMIIGEGTDPGASQRLAICIRYPQEQRTRLRIAVVYRRES